MDMREAGRAARTGRQALGAAAFSAVGLMVWRELHTAGCGAEYTAALWLGTSAAWLALGAVLIRLVNPGVRDWLGTPAIALLPVLTGLELWAARRLPAWCFGLSGGAAAPWCLALAAALLAAPLGLICGAVLAPDGQTGRERAGFWRRAGLGLAAGCGIFALCSLLLWHQVRTACLVAAVLACLASVAGGARLFGWGRLLLGAWALAVVTAAAGAEAVSTAKGWLLATGGRGGLLGDRAARCAAEKVSRRGLVVTMLGTNETATVFLAGVPVAAVPDPDIREDAVFACAQAKTMGRVLLDGAGRPGLVREMLLRGAVRVDMTGRFAETAAALLPHVTLRDADAFDSDNVRRLSGSPEPGGYDLVVVTVPGVRSAGAAAALSTPALARLSVLLARNGTLILLLPGEAGQESESMVQVWANCRELVEQRLVRQYRFHPGRRARVSLSALGMLPRDAAEAAAFYRAHEGPDGRRPAPVLFEEVSQLCDVPAAEKLSLALENRRKGTDLAGENYDSRRLFFLSAAEALSASAPRSAAAVLGAMELPPAVPFVAVWVLLVPAWLVARRSSGPGGPGRAAMLLAAGATGFIGIGAATAWCSSYGALRGCLSAALPLLGAAGALGLWAGARLAGTVSAAVGRAPRRALAAVEFCFLPILIVAPALTGLGAGSPWADLIHGLGALLLGAACGLHLESVRTLREPHEQAGWSCAVLVAACAGAFAAGMLAPTLVPEALAPSGTFLLLLAVRVASLGLLAAGAGRRGADIAEGEAGSETEAEAATSGPAD